jgi:hypothetical protein
MKEVWVICWEDIYLLVWSNGDHVNLFKGVTDNSSGIDDLKFIWWKIVHKLCVH